MTTMFVDLKEETTTTVDAILPQVGKRVIVKCDGFRCLGVYDCNGRWTDAYNGQELPEVLWFKPLG